MSKITWIIISALVIVVGIIIYTKVSSSKTAANTAIAAGAPKEIKVGAFIVHPQNIENNISASGSLLAFEDVDLHSEVSGKIVQLNLNEGTAVSKGTLLVKLFDDDLQAQLKKLDVQKTSAEKTADRLHQLLSINGVGQQEYDDAQTQVKSIQADMDNIKAQISKTEIRAPFNGIVGLRNVSMGAYLTQSTVVATLQQIDQMKIDFTIPEKYSTTVTKGNVLQFTVDGRNENFNAKVYAIEPKIDEQTRTIKVRALVQNTTAKLLPGMYAKVDVGLKNIENALMVPTQCIIPDARNKKVVVVKNGIGTFVKVETGLRNEAMIQITKGVEIGDTIVSTGIMFVKPNAKLKVTSIQ